MVDVVLFDPSSETYILGLYWLYLPFPFNQEFTETNIASAKDKNYPWNGLACYEIDLITS